MPTADASKIMTKERDATAPVTVEPAVAQSDAQPPRLPQAPKKTPWGAYVTVAIVALAIGAAGMFAALRVLGVIGRGASPKAQAAATTGQTSVPGMESVSGIDMSKGSGRPEGVSDKAIQISPERQQLIGVRTTTVTHQALESTVRTVGTLAYDETRVTMIHTKIAGWVDRLYVDYVGKLVQRGQPLFTVYSPDLVSTQKEYLLALRAQRQLGQSQFEETRAGAAALVSSARDRLKL